MNAGRAAQESWIHGRNKDMRRMTENEPYSLQGNDQLILLIHSLVKKGRGVCFGNTRVQRYDQRA